MKKDRESNIEIRYIKTIAELHSISAAAEVLGISQPALSAYLKKHEQDMGIKLFDRSSKPLSVTEEGRVYLDYMEKASALDRELAQKISDISGLRTGSLSVGGASFFNISYLPPAVAEFSRLYPNVELEIVDDKVPALSRRAYGGGLDLFITPRADDDDRFYYEKLLEEKIYLCIPESWKDCDISNAALPEGTYIVLREDQHIGQKMRRLFRKFNFEPEHIIVAEQTMTSMGLAMAGAGACLLTESSLKVWGLEKKLRHYIPDEDICHRDMYVAYPRNKYLSRAAAQFIEILKDKNKLK